MYSVVTGPPTLAHIHAATSAPYTGAAGIAVSPGSLPNFPDTITGSYNGVVDLSQTTSFGNSFLAGAGGTAEGATAALLAAFAAGKAYFNIHTDANPSGEVNGFICPEGYDAASATTCTRAWGQRAGGVWTGRGRGIQEQGRRRGAASSNAANCALLLLGAV